LQSGIDFLLFKNSPAFLTELLFYVQEAIEKRDLRTKLDQTYQRHLRLLETLSDVFYELDQSGRLVYISPSVTALLSYAPEELAGRHYSILLPPAQEHLARFLFNERRAGSRSVRQFGLLLLKKSMSEGGSEVIATELTAKGLYDHSNRYLGTVGLIKDMSRQKEQEGRLLELESKLRESDRRLALTQEAAMVTDRLQQPLTGLLNDSQRLLNTLQHVKIDQILKAMAAHAVEASELTRRLSHAIASQTSQLVSVDLNETIRRILQTAESDSPSGRLQLTTQLAQHVPPILGIPEQIEELVRILIDYAPRHAGVAPGSSLMLRTDTLSLRHASASEEATVFETDKSERYVALSIQNLGIAVSPAISPSIDSQSAGDFLRAHEIIRGHGGAIEIDNSRGAGLRITVRFPEVLSGQSIRNPPPSSITDSDQPKASELPKAASTDELPQTLTAERRRFVRRAVDLPIQLAIGNTGCPALIKNMSAGGALVRLHHVGPPLHLQPAYLLLKTPVSLLELQGIVHERPIVHRPENTEKELAILFSLPGNHDRSLIESLIDGALAGSTTLTIEGLVPLPPSSVASVEATTAAPQDPGISQERREAVRLRLAIPTTLNFPDQQSSRPLGLIVNLSRSGAAVELQASQQSMQLYQDVELVPTGPIGQIADHAHLAGSDRLWRGHIVWLRSPQSKQPGELPVQIGIRFGRLPLAQERILQRLIEAGSTTPFDLSEPIADSPIITVSRTIRNRRGLNLVLCHDVLRQTKTADRPVVLLCPGFGQTQASYVALAYFLAARGCRVIRYDASDHVGLSDGSIQHATMSSMEDDLDAVLSWIRQEWPHCEVTLLASDLVGRLVFRRADWHASLRRLLLINPALDVRESLEKLHFRDLVREHLMQTRFGKGNLLGFNMDIDRFLADIVASRWADLGASREDIKHCQTEVFFLRSSGETDITPLPAPPAHLVEDAIQDLGHRGRAVQLPSTVMAAAEIASDGLQKSWDKISHLCRSSEENAASHSLMAQVSKAAAIRYRLERDKLRGRWLIGTSTPEELWTVQTTLTSTLDELPGFWQLIDHMYQLAQPMNEGTTVLDAGCGVHSFARLLLLNLSYRLRSQAWRQTAPVRYVGVDFSTSVLRSAQSAAKEATDRLDAMFSGRISSRPPLRPTWILSRSIESLPVASGSFEHTLANLSVSFSRSPVHALRELYRILKPNGKLVLSTFTPSADFAQLYRPHLHDMGGDAFAGEARLNLSHMARFCEALRTGELHAFEEESLAALIHHATGSPASTIQRAASGHILVATVEKPVSVG
jgi:PAS domain S-box-containing protein